MVVKWPVHIVALWRCKVVCVYTRAMGNQWKASAMGVRRQETGGLNGLIECLIDRCLERIESHAG